jgi:hypothetical protein
MWVWVCRAHLHFVLLVQRHALPSRRTPEQHVLDGVRERDNFAVRQRTKLEHDFYVRRMLEWQAEFSDVS